MSRGPYTSWGTEYSDYVTNPTQENYDKFISIVVKNTLFGHSPPMMTVAVAKRLLRNGRRAR